MRFGTIDRPLTGVLPRSPPCNQPPRQRHRRLDPGAAWQARATSDFNGDGKSDIALQNVNTGDVNIWQLNVGRHSGAARSGEPGIHNHKPFIVA